MVQLNVNQYNKKRKYKRR